jgi:hypothetical protein
MALMAVLAAAVSAAPMVSNGDFKSREGATKLPAGWQVPEALREAWAVVDDDGHSGNDSLRYQADKTLKGEPVVQEVACEPQTDYVLSAWLKAGTLKPLVRIAARDDEGRDVAVAPVEAANAAGWIGRSARFNSGKMTRLRIEVFASAAAPGGDVPAGNCWVDDVQIVPAAEYKEEAGRAVGGYAGPPPGPNLARGKPYTLKPAPSYGYCTDPGDATQLTDGEYSVGYFWVQKGTVGWSGAVYVDIVIDLGTQQPIAGCSYNTAAGVAGVSWPQMMLILVSDDGKTWYSGGDLVAHAAKYGLPPAEGYSVHRFVATDLKLHGRYFRLLIAPSASYCFCDEVEVYGGPPALAAADLGAPVEKVEDKLIGMRVVTGVRTRLLRDIETLRQEAKAEGVPAPVRAEAEAAAKKLETEAIGELGPFDEFWRAIHPLNAIHARIYAARAKVKRSLGAPAFSVWTKCPWDMLGPNELPAKPAAPTLAVPMMQNEYRAAVLNLSNMGDAEMIAKLALKGLPGGPKPGYLAVHQVETVETQSGIPVADALPLADVTPTGWRVTVPAGMTRQVWLTFHPTDLKAGTHRGELAVETDGKTTRVPVELKVYPLRFPGQPTCSIGMWDYTGQSPSYDIQPGNVQAAVANMRSHYLDTPWGAGGEVPWPKGFDANDALATEPDYGPFDFWMDRWEGSRNYAIFLALDKSAAGMTIGDAHFTPRVASWMKAWMAHAQEKFQVKPSQFYFLILDEPSQKEQEEIIIAWAKAIKAAVPEVNIWEDPVHQVPERAALPEMFQVSDVLCPNLGIFAGGPESSRQFYEQLRQQGKRLWFYQCSGPAKTYDPYYYHRLQEWYCFKYGMTGTGFWAYGDAAGSGNAWNELRAPRTSYTPVYLDQAGVTDGKHWEAVREGVEDFEYLTMLRAKADDLEKKGDAAKAAKLRELLTSVVDDVCGQGYNPGGVAWTTERDRTRADAARVKVLEALVGG